jgi:hypothetical protein
VGRLHRKIHDDLPTMNLWWRYYIGDHPIPEVPEKVRERIFKSYQAILARANANFMGVVIDSLAERLRPVGFRLGADHDFKTDLDSWLIWQASSMDADAPLAIETTLAKGRSYLSVWHHNGDELPTIAAEDPGQCIVEHVPGSRHRRAAALKTYVDDWTGQDRADLFLPGELRKWIRDSNTGGWVPLPNEEDPVPNPVGYQGVPVVPLVNRPRLAHVPSLIRRQLKWGGDSDLSDVTSIQDRINETILNGVITQWFGAFRQKWAAGLVVDEEVVTDSEGNPVLDSEGKPKMQPVEPFDVWVDRMLVVDNENVKFGEFDQTDLSGYLKMRERDLQDLSTIKRIPRHYLFQEGQSPSGDAIKSAETGLVARQRRARMNLDDGLEEANRIARFMAGGGEAAPDSEMVWADPEFQTYGQLVDGVIKEFGDGLITWEEAREKLGYSPQQTARAKAERDMDSLLGLLEQETPEREAVP